MIHSAAKTVGPGAVVLLRKMEWLFALIVIPAATIALSFWAHNCAGFSFPPPWPDESAFAWQSVAFQEDLTLFAPQINSQRQVMWMPPGYFVVTGTILKLTGFSFDAVRLLSWIYLVLAYAALLILFRKSPWRIACYLLVSLVFLNSFCIVAGNVGRMETLLLATVFAGLLLLHEGKVWSGLAVMSLGLLIHPNGLYFLSAGIVWCFLEYRLKWPRPEKLGVAMISLALIAWFAYCCYVAANWSSFVHDMRVQFAGKAAHAFSEFFLAPKYLVFAGILLVAGVVALIRYQRALLLLLFSASFLAARLIGLEMWYGVFVSMSVVFLFCAILHMAGTFLVSLRPKRQWVLYLSMGVLLSGLTGAAVLAGIIDLAPGYPMNLKMCDMNMRSGPAYINVEDKAGILAAIRARQAGGGVRTISFIPSADCLFFYPASKGIFTVSDPQFSSSTADTIIIHRTSVGSEFIMQGVSRALESTHARAEHLVYERELEQWYLVTVR